MLDLGVMALHVDNDPVLGWCAIASHEPHTGTAKTIELAKIGAMQSARNELLCALEILDQMEKS